MIRKDESRWNDWVFDWVSTFIKTSASYASNLLESSGDFYKVIVREFTSNLMLRESLGNLLEWMAFDTHYKQSVSCPSFEQCVIYNVRTVS
jgi:hypothetical protein